MEPTSVIWQTDAIRAAMASGDLGGIVRGIRNANHITLADLSKRCGYSTSTLSRMERGKQPISDVRVLRSLAEALRVPPRLFGLADTPPRPMLPARPLARVGVPTSDELALDEETDSMRRRTLLLAGLTSLAGAATLGHSGHSIAAANTFRALETSLLDPLATGGVPVGVPRLRQQVVAARSVFQLGRYTDVVGRLPGLLSTATATRAEAATGEQLAEVTGLLAELYVLASELMVKLGNDRLAWTTADRAVQVADSAHDVLTQAGARRAWAIVLRRAGHADTAQRLVVDTAAGLQPDLHRSPGYLAAYGSMLSTAAYTAAVDGDQATARGLIDEAAGASEPTAVGLYRISIARVLGDYGTAIEVARRIDPVGISQVERRARYWSDVARAFHGWGRPEPCYRALLAAEHASPDEVRYHRPVQQITLSLLRHPTAHTLPGLRAFAARTGTSG